MVIPAFISTTLASVRDALSRNEAGPGDQHNIAAQTHCLVFKLL
jgi:hypothetical protein